MSHTSTIASTRRYAVAGMTCRHCVMSVTDEVSEIAGVTDVAVDLATGGLTVTGAGFSDEAVTDAVAEAGYEVIA
jgi:copper chaperone